MFHGIPVDPFIPEAEKIKIVKRIYQGKQPVDNNDPVYKVPNMKIVNDADQLVSQITTSIKMEKVVFLLPKYSKNKQEIVTLNDIVKFFHLKKAKFEYFTIPDRKYEEKIFEFLCILKQCMEFGQIMVINIDSKFETREFLGEDSFTDILPVGVLNRDPRALYDSFRDFGIDPPEYIHENFIFVLLGSKKVVVAETTT